MRHWLRLWLKSSNAAAVMSVIQGLDLTPASRVKKETTAGIWQRMQAGTWPFAAKFRGELRRPSDHSDGKSWWRIDGETWPR